MDKIIKNKRCQDLLTSTSSDYNITIQGQKNSSISDVLSGLMM